MSPLRDRLRKRFDQPKVNAFHADRTGNFFRAGALGPRRFRSVGLRMIGAMPSSHQTLKLIRRLARALEEEKIVYCHWKSNNALDRSARGENDLDLLVRRADEARFARAASGLGFKQAHAPRTQAMPAVLDYYGYDEGAQRFVHLHVHYQLIVGHDATKNYRLPIERQYLESATRNAFFNTPSPEFEFVVLVIRMITKHSTWDTILLGHGTLQASERQELVDLQGQVDREEVRRIVKEHLPFISPPVFALCAQALAPRAPFRRRLKAGRVLLRALRPHTRRARTVDISLKFLRHVTGGIRRRVLRRVPKRRLASGGAIVAITGGDGSGKTTALDGLSAWLSRDFDVRKVHFGKPGWSLTTILVRGALRVGRSLGLSPYVSETAVLYSDNADSDDRFPGRALLVRLVCTARDRYLVYLKARRFVTGGGLVLADRFPFSRSNHMDGPHVERLVGPNRAGWLVKRLIQLEASYYRSILWPEILVVLELDPEIAVRRKTDEPSAYVRARSQETAAVDWRSTPARVIDASQSREDVLSRLKSLIWSEL